MTTRAGAAASSASASASSSAPSSSAGVPGLPDRPRRVSPFLAIDILGARALPFFLFFIVACAAFGVGADDADLSVSGDDVVVGSCVVGAVSVHATDDDDKSKVTIWRAAAACDVDGARTGVDSYYDDGHAPAVGAVVAVLDDDDGARRHLVLRGGRQRPNGAAPLGLVTLMIVVIGGVCARSAAGKRDDLLLLRDGARGFATLKSRQLHKGSGDDPDVHALTFVYVDEEAGGVERELHHSDNNVDAVTDDEREAILYRGDRAALVDALPGRPVLDPRGRFVSSRPLRTAVVVFCVVGGGVVCAACVVSGVVDIVDGLR